MQCTYLYKIRQISQGSGEGVRVKKGEENGLKTSHLEGEDVLTPAYALINPGLGVEARAGTGVLLRGHNVVVGKGLLQGGD